MSSPEHYPAHARYAAMMAEQQGYEFTDLDGRGYVFAIANGNRRFVSGAGLVCAYPVNSATAHEIARDKTHTKTVLAAHHLDTIPGRLFFVQDRYQALHPPAQDAQAAYRYAEQLGYPVFAKPNRGSRGDFAQIIRGANGLGDYIVEVSRYYDSIVIEAFVPLTEYRVLVFDDQPVYQLRKTAPVIVGDGQSTIADLLARLNRGLADQGLSDFQMSSLLAHHDTPDLVLEAGRVIAMAGRHNLDSRGGYEDFSLTVDAPLSRTAIKAVQCLGLRFAAVDLFVDLDTGQHRVIELNSNPSITVLEQAGEMETILKIWTKIAGELL